MQNNIKLQHAKCRNPVNKNKDQIGLVQVNLDQY